MGIPGVFAKTYHLHHQEGTVHQEYALPVTSGQTIRRGDFVQMTTGDGTNTISQAIALPGTDNTAAASGGNAPIYGVAQTDMFRKLNDDTNWFVDVVPISKGLQVLVPIYNATGANAEQQDLDRTAYYQLGRWRGPNANTWWYYMSTVKTNGELRPLSYYQGDALDTDYGRIYVQVRDGIAQS